MTIIASKPSCIILILFPLLVSSIQISDELPSEQSVPIKRLHKGFEADTLRYNFVVAILLNTPNGWAFHCGGSIVTPRKIVTAAHCVFDSDMMLPSPKLIAVVAGDESWSGSGENAVVGRVTAIYSHENYRSPHSEPDLAMLILKKDLPIDNNTIGTIELAQKAPKDGTECIALGWGLNEHFYISTKLMAAKFQIQPIEACILFYGVPSPNFVCGMSTNKSAVCTGDSGGPLVCNNRLAGIIDSSALNCSGTKPSLFTRIGDYAEWIKRERGFTKGLYEFKLSAYWYFCIVCMLV